jgi:hypothetical protein
MAIFAATRSTYPNAEDQGKVLGTVHFAGVPESMDEKITDATGIRRQPFEEGTLVTFRDALALPDTILQIAEVAVEDE